jgi:drug/metabolite transporter (DMT)-like permease
LHRSANIPEHPTGGGKRSSLTGTAFALLAATGFSAKSILIKMAYAYPLDATVLLTMRMLFAAPFFIVMALWSGRVGSARPLTRRQWLAVAGLGFTGYYLASYLDFLGLTYITAGLERLILFLYPTIVVLLSAWWLRKPVRYVHWIALALSYGGIGLVFAENLSFGGHAHDVAWGSSLVFASGLIYALYLIGAGEIIAQIGATRFTAYAMLIACIVCVIHLLLTHDRAAIDLPVAVYGLALAMAIVSTVIPAWLMSEAIRLAGANHAALVGSVGPIATILFGYWFLDEPITAVQLLGATLVLVGVTFVSFRKA